MNFQAYIAKEAIATAAEIQKDLYGKNNSCHSVTLFFSLDREARKVIVENGGNHPLGSVAQLYISRKNGGRDFRSVKAECKSTKIKAAVKLFENPDTTMSAVRKFEEKAVHTGCRSIIKDAGKYTSELHLTLTLQYPNPRATTEDSDASMRFQKFYQYYIKNSYVHRDYFMLGECARFLFTSERDKSFNNNTALQLQ